MTAYCGFNCEPKRPAPGPAQPILGINVSRDYMDRDTSAPGYYTLTGGVQLIRERDGYMLVF